MKIESTREFYHQNERAALDVTTKNSHDANEAKFQDLWAKLQYVLGDGAMPEATALFEAIQHRFPGRLQESQLLALRQTTRDWKVVKATPAQCLAEQARGPGGLGTSDQSRLGDLPARRIDAGERSRVQVTKGSTIRVKTNTYSVPSQLIGALVDVHITAESVEVWHRDELVETLPRLRGQHKCLINYRHVLGWLASEPAAFAHYRYRDALFPTSRFRQAYDRLVSHFPPSASANYLRILRLAADGHEALVDAALGRLLDWGAPIVPAFVEEQLQHELRIERTIEAHTAAWSHCKTAPHSRGSERIQRPRDADDQDAAGLVRFLGVGRRPSA